jgi:hypothetical protein
VLYGAIESFNVSGGDFDSYVERFEQFLKINSIKTDMKVPMFITYCGSETYEVLKHLMIPDTPVTQPYEKIKEVLLGYFSPKRIVIVERFRFYKREQLTHETITNYIVELKKLAKNCNFGTAGNL